MGGGASGRGVLARSFKLGGRVGKLFQGDLVRRIRTRGPQGGFYSE